MARFGRRQPFPWKLRRPPVIGAGGGGASYTLTADYGAFVLSGQDAGLRAARILTAANGSASLTGQDAGLAAGWKVTAAYGSFALTGQTAALKATRVLVADVGTVTLSGQSASLVYGHPLAAGQATFTLTGQVASLRVARVLIAEVEGFNFDGNAATLTYSGAPAERPGGGSGSGVFGMCCGCGTGGGSGTPPDATCGAYRIPGNFDLTIAGLITDCVVPDAPCANRAPVENKSYTLARVAGSSWVDSACDAGRPCRAIYYLNNGTLTMDDVFAVYGLTRHADCNSVEDDIAPFRLCAEIPEGRFAYIGQYDCSGSTVDSYLSITIDFDASPVAYITIEFIHIVDSLYAFYGTGLQPSYIYTPLTAGGCTVVGSPGTCCDLQGTVNNCYLSYGVSLPDVSPPNWTFESIVSAPNDCCGATTVTLSG